MEQDNAFPVVQFPKPLLKSAKNTFFWTLLSEAILDQASALCCLAVCSDHN